MSDMKICILSMQNVANFGSLLQGYSLQKILTELGHDVSFISIESNVEDNKLMQGNEEDYSEETGGRGFQAKLSCLDRYAINRILIKQLNVKQIEEFARFRTSMLHISPEQQEQSYDYCVIGSDEVFNCNVASSWGFTSQLFGNVRQAEHVITYAASCGSTVVNKVPARAADRIKKAMANISALSVRDENTKVFVEQLTGKKTKVHLDPVLVGDFSKEIAVAERLPNIPKKFCLVYSYYNRINKKEDISILQKFCKLYELEIVSVGAPQMWIKKHIVCDPFQMLTLFQKATFVITDTFHGTIFSAKYSRRFAVLVRESNRNKLLDLVKRISIEDHLMDGMEELELLYAREHDKTALKNLIEQERYRTIKYLKTSIK